MMKNKFLIWMSRTIQIDTVENMPRGQLGNYYVICTALKIGFATKLVFVSIGLKSTDICEGGNINREGRILHAAARPAIDNKCFGQIITLFDFRWMMVVRKH